MIRIGGGKWKCYWWHEPECPDELQFRDEGRARMWLQQFHADAFGGASLRSLLAKDGSSGMQSLSDEKVLDLVARKLVTREIRVFQSRRSPAAAALAAKPREAEQSPAFPLEERRAASQSSSAAAQAAEEDLFSSNADLVAIAAVLTDAARLGTPF